MSDKQKPALELLTKGADDKWHKVGALWKKATVEFSGTVTLGDQTVNVIAVPPREPKAKPEEAAAPQRPAAKTPKARQPAATKG